ncbi:hypothetical protein Tco_1140505, partial [Tanacetum coccineum]
DLCANKRKLKAGSASSSKSLIVERVGKDDGASIVWPRGPFYNLKKTQEGVTQQLRMVENLRSHEDTIKESKRYRVQHSKEPRNVGVIEDQKAGVGTQSCGGGNSTYEEPSKRRSVI